MYAWVERYGLGGAYGRLRRPPVARTSRAQNLVTDKGLANINGSLAALPFRGMAIACPFTPNIPKMAAADRHFDEYAGWIADIVVPRARREAPVLTNRAHTALDGVSLGGHVGIEVLVRRPEVFGQWGSVQGAFNTARLAMYSERLAGASSVGSGVHRPAVRLATTNMDPFHDANVALSGCLTREGIPHDLVVGPGLHDQVYLREIGCLEMLLWHDRRAR